jgi:hypothetical protein
MLTTRIFVAPLMVLSAFLMLACDDHPTAPSRPTSPSPPVPAPATQVWNLTVRLVAAEGGECVGETMRSSQLEIPRRYSLSITQAGSSVEVTLRSASGDYACTFPARAEGDGFTTVGVPGFMSCETYGVVRFVCGEGRARDLLSLGENISGHISGNQITGKWTVSWAVMEAGGGGGIDLGWLEATHEYTGTR